MAAHRLFIFGGKSTALEIAETARRFLRPQFSGVVLVVPEDEPADGSLRVRTADLPGLVEQCDGPAGYLISMWSREVRDDCLAVAESLGMVPLSVVHPMAFVSESAVLGQGVYVAASSVVSAAAVVGDHVVINYNVTVGHDSVVGSHSFLNPGARVSGNVTIGRRVLVGSNAFIYQGLTIGDDSLIDALTYVDRDIRPGMICSSRQLRVHKRVF